MTSSTDRASRSPHGVDGFLVKRGAHQDMADHVVELIRNPELVAKMGAAGFAKAARHDSAAFLEDWRTVLDGVVAAKERRTTLDVGDADGHAPGRVAAAVVPR